MAVGKIPVLPQYGGYEYEFVNEVPKRFVCLVCSKVLRNPHITKVCGQHFCETCLRKWFRTQGREVCPHCRSAGKEFIHFINKALKREIDDLKIYCTNRKVGCGWEGELSSLETHLESEKGCGHVEVNCTNKCKEHMKRKDLADHLTQRCPLRKYKCQHCGKEDTCQTITEKHYDECPSYPLDCPNECGARGIKRAEMGQHRSVCPLERIKCSNKCKKRLLRKYLDDHLTQRCPLRKYKCQYCGKEDTYQTITEKHYDQCLNYPLDCPNECGAREIKRAEMDQHQSECPMEPVECPYGCMDDYGLKQKDLDDHLIYHCRLRDYICTYCDERDTYTHITEEHYDMCPNYPLNCPNNCGVMRIKRVEMEQHQSQCPLELVQCPFQDAGCQAKLIRKEFDSHMATNQQQHLLTLMGAFKEAKDDLTKARTELEALKTTQEVIATDVMIMHQNDQKELSDLALASIKSQLGVKSFRLKADGQSLIFRMTNFSHYRQSGKVWYSPPFYYDAGYKMQLAVNTNGTGADAGIFMSIALQLMKGEFDHQIPWPIDCIHDISVEMIPQKSIKSGMVKSAIALATICHSKLFIINCWRCTVADCSIVKEGVRKLDSNDVFCDHKTIKNTLLLNDSLALKTALIEHRCHMYDDSEYYSEDDN